MLVLASALHGATRHGERVTATGAWVLPSHFEYHLDAALADAISQLLLADGAHSVLDVGAGKGLYVRYMRAAGLAAHGTDGAIGISSITRGLVVGADLTRPFARCRSHDWAVSLEVAEHIPRAAEATYLANLNCSAARGLVLSWAPPGQAGSGHVNTRPMAEVRELVGALGLVVDEAASAALRRAATLPWFKRNLIVLRRIDAGAEDARGVAGARGPTTEHDAPQQGALLPASDPSAAGAAAGAARAVRGGASGDLTAARALFAKLRVAAAEIATAAELDAPLDALEAELGRPA